MKQSKIAAWMVVTGASSGMGRSYAQRLASQGHNVVLIARRADRLDALERELETCGVDIRTIVADLANATDLDRVCAELASLPVEMLVNNAGLAHYMAFCYSRRSAPANSSI